MSVIESFYFLFKGDASNLKTGLKDADESADNLEKKLQQTDETAEKLGENMSNLAKSAGKALAALFTLHEVKKLTQETNEHNFSLRQQAYSLNMSVESLSKWQQMVKLSGGTAEGATASIQSLHDKFIAMAKFGGIMTAEGMGLQMLGLSKEEMHASINDPMIAMRKLSDTFHGLQNDTQRVTLGKQLGFDVGTIALLSQGSKALDDLIKKQKELGFVTEKQAFDSAKLHLKFTELNLVWESASRTLLSSLTPALIWLMDKFEQLMLLLKEHQPAVTAFFAVIGAGVLYLNVWAIALAGMTALFIGIGAAIALVADDIYSFIKGGDSLIGRAVEKWPVLGEVFRAIGQIISMMWDGTKQVFQQFYDWAGKLAEPWEHFKQVIKSVWDTIKEAPLDILNWIGKHLSGLTGGHYDPITGKGVSAVQRFESDATGAGKRIAAKLMAMGWSKEQAAGMAGNILQESSGNAGAMNESGHYGLAQWGKNRQMDFQEWSGHSIFGSTEDEQLAFMNYELTKGKERAAGRKIKGSSTAEGAAISTRAYYERPGLLEANDAKRVGYANDILGGLSSNSMNGAVHNSSRSGSVSIGKIEVHTQATSGEEVNQAIAQNLQTHLKNTLLQFDDGEAA